MIGGLGVVLEFAAAYCRAHGHRPRLVKIAVPGRPGFAGFEFRCRRCSIHLDPEDRSNWEPVDCDPLGDQPFPGIPVR